MHELSIAMTLVDIASERLPQLGERVRVSAVHVRIGPLSGIVPDALLFSFDVAAAGSAVEGARLEIESVPLTAWCDRCQAEQLLGSVQCLRCPACGSATPHVLTGRELELRALEVIDTPSVPDPASPEV